MMLQLSTHLVGDTAVVDCEGKIVYGDEAAFLRSFFKDILNQHHCIVLNLAGVTHLDSSGIGAIVGLWASARNLGGDLKLAAMSSRVQDALTMSRLTALLGVFESPEAAAASFTAGEGLQAAHADRY